jgi:hypothetical protein
VSNSTLQKLLREWQKTLRLQDWRVVAKFASPMEFQNGGAVGECHVSALLKQAEVLLLDDEHLAGERLFNADIEVSLVHELLHLPLQAWTRNNSARDEQDPRYWQAEQAIEQIALALVGLKRGGRIE